MADSNFRVCRKKCNFQHRAAACNERIHAMRLDIASDACNFSPGPWPSGFLFDLRTIDSEV